MRYERNLQAQLRERYRQLFKAGFMTFKREIEYFRKFVRSVPALSAIIDSIQRSEPDLDPDKWYAEKFISFRDYDFPGGNLHRIHQSVFPGFVAQRFPIEFLAVVLPQRHEMIHVGDETIVVMALEQMNHFMDNDVL